MIKEYINLKDVDRESLISTVSELTDSMKIKQSDIYENKHESDFIVTFPKGISNELFIFFYCALMAPDLTNSKELFGWFSANDDMTLNYQNGEFSNFHSKDYSMQIMILPEGDDKGNFHQYGVTENGKEIHFGMDGTYKVLENSEYKYEYPISNLNEYERIETIEPKKGFFEKLKIKLGL
ncbi:hypothetical protein MG296_14445 [Flavobacteriaceae bacterium TK19130]|nr:hypothetical protein [Thermobacterium salinum]